MVYSNLLIIFKQQELFTFTQAATTIRLLEIQDKSFVNLDFQKNQSNW